MTTTTAPYPHHYHHYHQMHDLPAAQHWNNQQQLHSIASFPPTNTPPAMTSCCDVYVSLIQQYIAVFQYDNAIFLIDRCLADIDHGDADADADAGTDPDSDVIGANTSCASSNYNTHQKLHVIYLQAICYYRKNQIKYAKQCLYNQLPTIQQLQYQCLQKEMSSASSLASSSSSSSSSSSATTSTPSLTACSCLYSSMLYLLATCCYELKDYSTAETTLLQNAKQLYRNINSNNAMTNTHNTVGATKSNSTTIQQQPQQQQQQHSEKNSMESWIVQTTPCPIPNGAVGCALLGNIYRKLYGTETNKHRAIQYYYMSLQLDPFLFTSYQSLVELGEDHVDASSIFGSNSFPATAANTNGTITNTVSGNNNISNGTVLQDIGTNNDNHYYGTTTATTMKTPLHATVSAATMDSTPSMITTMYSSKMPSEATTTRGEHASSTTSTTTGMGLRPAATSMIAGFETPGLTPITRNHHNDDSYAGTLRSSITPINALSSIKGGLHQNNPVLRRAKQIVHRQYYPPSPDVTTTAESEPQPLPSSSSISSKKIYNSTMTTNTPDVATPITSVTRSMRYLRGLGTHYEDEVSNSINHGDTRSSSIGANRSLFPPSSSMQQAKESSFCRTVAPPSATALTGRQSPNTIDFKPNVSDNGIVVRVTAFVNAGLSKPVENDFVETSSSAAVQHILNILATAGTAYHHLCQYRCTETIQQLQKLPPSQQRTAWVLHQKGRAYFELGDFISAQRCLESMHMIDPGRMQGLDLLSTVYWQLKKEVDLANLAQRTMDWDYLSPYSHCVAGNCYSLQKDQETALVFFRRSLQLDPNFTYIHTLSGYEYMANEDFGKATICFRKALQIDDRHYNAWYGLGMIYHRQEKYDLAEYHFEQAVKIHPSSGVLRCNLGMAQNANGKAYVALETLSEAFRLDPRNPQARFQRATIYSSLHRPEEALAELKVVRDAAPREATVYFAMGKILKRLGRLDEAMKCFLTAMDLDPKDNQMIKSAMDKLGEPEGDEEGSANY